jgi:hypothetical protein
MHHTKRMRAALHTLAVVVKARGLRLRQQQKRQMGSAQYGRKIVAIHESPSMAIRDSPSMAIRDSPVSQYLFNDGHCVT